jgi:PAS domain S-box-containing protein
MRWLFPPQVEDEYEQVAYHSLHYSLQLMMVIGLITLFPPTSIVDMTLVPIGLVFSLICYGLLHQRHLHLAGAIFLGGIWLLITAVVFWLNGINNVAVYSYVVIIIFADIIFARRWVVLGFTLLSILSSIVLTIGEWQRILPLYSTGPILTDRLLIALLIFCATGILSSLASGALHRNLARLHQNEKTLEARNRELEALTRNLVASEERYRLLFDNATMMAAVYDSDGQIVLVNEATLRMLGKPRSSVEHHRIDEVYSAEDAELLTHMNQQVLHSGKIAAFEGSDILPDGKRIYYLRHVIPLPSSNPAGSTKQQLLGLTTDLTEQKHAIERQQALQAAQEKIDFLTDFFSVVSHDIKTPLAIMSTNLYLLKHAKDAERQKRIDLLDQQVKTLDQYIQDLLEISRLEHVPILEKKPVDAKSLISDIIQSFAPKLEQKSIQWHFQQPDEDVIVKADENQLRRVLINLIENAINYTPENGEVFIVLSQQADTMLIDVRDTGIGIQSEDLPHIFDKFYRTSDAKTVLSGGTGLGLTITKKIVDLHGGSISVQSELGQGSSFHLVLPN